MLYFLYHNMNAILELPGLLCSTLLADILLGGFIYLLVKCLHEIIPTIKENYRLLSLIPSPSRSWFYGHMLLFSRNQDGLFKRVELITKYPSMYCFFIGPIFSIITTHHPDLAKLILSSDTHKSVFFKKVTKMFLGDGLLSTDGIKWKKQRHMLNPAFHVEILKVHVNVFNETVKTTLQWLEEQVKSEKACDIHPPCSRLSFDNMARCIMSQPGVKDGEDMKLIQNLKEIQKLVITRFLNPIFHSDFLYKFTSGHRKFESLVSMTDIIIKKIINERKQMHLMLDSLKVNNSENNIENELGLLKTRKKIDFLDILLLSKYENGNKLSETEILDQVRLFFAAGSETTGNAMTWLAYTLSQNQDWQEKCREEIFEICGNEKDIEWEDIAKLRNLHLCIKETLRLYPIAPFLGRAVHSPVTIMDPYDDKKLITLKPGTQLNVCVFALHRHPEFWDNPNTFDPERFTLDRSKDRRPFSYIPFSASYRNCIGQQFAMYEMKVSFAHILRKFKLVPAPDCPPPCMIPEVTLVPKDHVFIKVENVSCR